jgi:hypothetical protein
MNVHCGIEYHIETPGPPTAKFALRYGWHVRYFRHRENAEAALNMLPFEDREHATISKLEDAPPCSE